MKKRGEAYTSGPGGAAKRVAFGLLVGILLAEGIVRVLGLGPEVAPAPVLLENPAKTLALECYPPGGADPMPIDLRRAGLLEAFVGRGLDAEALTSAKEATPLCVQLDYNAQTRRDATFEPAEEGASSVLVVGDSFTEGAGVTAEATFVSVLNRELGAHRRVWNGGRRGLDQPDISDSLERLLPLTQPDVVLYAMALNDFEQDPAWAERQAFLNDLILDRQRMGEPDWKLSALLRRSRLAVFVASRVRTARASRDTVQWYRGMTGPGNAQGWTRTRSDLSAMKAQSEDAGARFVVALLPLLVGLEEPDGSGYPFTDLHRDIAEACAERDIEFVDLLPEFLGRDSRSLHVHDVDMHPNAAGHRIIAEGLRGPLERLDEAL